MIPNALPTVLRPGRRDGRWGHGRRTVADPTHVTLAQEFHDRALSRSTTPAELASSL